MSRFTRFAATSQMLSITAMEEASRRGLREADLQDLFLALVLNDGRAGQVLRDRGVTIGSARAAVEELQQQQIRSLGVSVDMPPAGRIVSHETAGYEWSRRAAELLRRSAGKDGDYATGVLRELIDEPSGLVTELLHRLGTTREDVAVGLGSGDPGDLGDAGSPHRPALTGPGSLRRTTSQGARTFVPASVDDVWELLTDPRRVPEWDISISSVDVDDADSPGTGPRTKWIGRACTEHTDGKPVRMGENFVRRSVEHVELLYPERIVWRTAYPDAPTGVPFLTAFDLTATTGGTRLTITTTWQRRRGWRSAIGLLLAPVQRFFLWFRVSQISAAVSRVFR